MHPLTRHLPLILVFLLPVFLFACGGKSSSAPSSQVFSGHSAVFQNASTIQSWGANGFGQIGNGSANDVLAPVRLTKFSNTLTTNISVGSAHTLAYDSANNGTVWAWGYNGNGQLGNNTTTNGQTPAKVLQADGKTPLTYVLSVAAGGRHSLALMSGHTVMAWGDNTFGQLGVPSTDTPSGYSTTPVSVTDTNLTSITKIAAGGDFSLALKDDGTGAGTGTVWAWGNNSNGQLGIPNTTTATTYFTPQQVVKATDGSTLSNIIDIAAGGSHGLAIDKDGNIWAWGYNIFGQLGDGTTTTRFGAVKANVITGTAAGMKISAGLDHSAAIINGSVYAWGYNVFGQLGLLVNGQTQLHSFEPRPISSTPVQVTALGSNVDFILAVGNHSIARTGDGKFWTWGWDAYGQLGDGATTDRSNPVVVLGP